MTPRALAALTIAIAACSQPAPPPAVTATAPTAPAVAPATAPAVPAATAPAPFAVQVTGHGPPMILIPGLASSGEVWAGVVAHERARFTCHVVTLAGFAGQPRIAAPMLTTVRDALAAYITEHHLDRPVIVGHSLGGFVALDLASARPELVGRLVIVDSLPFLAAAMNPAATPESMRASADAIRAGMRAASPEARRAQLSGMIATMVTAPADRAVVLDWGLASDAGAVVDALVELLTSDLRPRLAAITAPALVIGTWQGLSGETHASVGKIFAAQYASLHAEIVIADHARHFVMLDDPAFLYAQLDRFVGTAAR